MNGTQASWRELYRTDDRQFARVLATCIEAMEFEARMVSLARPRSFVVRELPEHGPDGPYVVEVRVTDWDELRDVLPDILDEQQEFDELLAAWEHREARAHRQAIIALAIVVAALGTAGLIEL